MPNTHDETARLRLLLDLSRGFSSHLDLDSLLPVVLKRSKEVLQAEAFSLLLIDETAQEFYFPATSSLSLGVDEQLRDLRFPLNEGIAGEVLRTGRSQKILDPAHDPHFYSGVDTATGLQTRSLLAAPLRTHEGIVGVAEAVNSLEGSFDDDDLAFLDTLAHSIGVAILNARAMDQIRLREGRLEREVVGLRRERGAKDLFPEVVGNSPALRHVLSLMMSAVDSSISVLLEGETGTGKEVVARAIHGRGSRAKGSFVPLNCGALPAELLESELFGFARGAFTNANHDKAGLFEVADGGTLFLDEVGEMPLNLQVKLLRVLQEGELRRLGETHSRRVDVRVISATHRNLADEIEKGTFREDLYYRLRVFPISIPPLRERKEDIAHLSDVALDRIRSRLDRDVGALTNEALERLMAYDWPGNVRELENELERAVALTAAGTPIEGSRLSDRLDALPASDRAETPVGEAGSLREARLAFERQFIKAALERNDDNATRAARELGISRQMVHKKIRDWELRS